ncbi:MAG: alkaline phosphatase D family protein [Bacteroidetes bacterium]|nr:alkaline phosphatase D family protein [Bacteroidota bacterium]MBP6638959.1 alkaline phosphatase D family protein [Bacteroidia bacterium]MBP6721254.1 alkaline phosphatase D family protein [Bacteroidia bacterium]
MRIHQLFLLLSLTVSGLSLKSQTLPPNIYADSAHAPFLHGVASFDPTATKVILWTKVDPEINSGPITLTWETFADANLTQQLATGTATASVTSNWTAQADVDFPDPERFYWYRWKDSQSRFSVVGRTKTASQGADAQARLAIMSCSSVYSGYFNAYQRIATRNDIDLVVHLGDYIYDFVDADEQVRVPSPAPVDPQTLAEWRDRHSYYLLDPDLRAARQNHPWAVIWDNHDVDGDSPQHVADAIQAFQEYVPMRLTDAILPHLIYRRLAYGDLLDILLVDATTLRDIDTLPNGEFSMLGNAQWNWLSQELSSSTALWRVIGQERMMAEFSTAGLGSLINYGDGPVADSGAWDGYNGERVRLLNHLDQNGIDNNVILSGDIHTSFLCDLPIDYGSYDDQTGAGSVAVEFLPTSITRGNFDEQGVTGFLAQLVQGAIALANAHHVYSELTSHGYGILDIRPDVVTAEYWYSPILQASNSESFATGYECRTGENHWRRAALSNPTTVLVASEDATLQNVTTSLFPNPAGESATLRLNAARTETVNILVMDPASGKQVLPSKRLKLKANQPAEMRIDLTDLPSGHYQILLENGTVRQAIPLVHFR